MNGHLEPETRPVRVIVAGSRSIEDSQVVWDAIHASPHDPFHGELVSGGANGVDSTAREIASVFEHIDYKEFEADWGEHGKAAGPIRNKEMAEYSDALIAVWDGESPGTRNMIDVALGEGLDVYVKVEIV